MILKRSVIKQKFNVSLSLSLSLSLSPTISHSLSMWTASPSVRSACGAFRHFSNHFSPTTKILQVWAAAVAAAIKLYDLTQNYVSIINDDGIGLLNAVFDFHGRVLRFTNHHHRCHVIDPSLSLKSLHLLAA